MNVAHILFGRPWLFYQKKHNDKEANTYTLFKNGRWSRLIPMTSSSLSSSTPSTAAPQKEQKVERVVMIAPKELTSNIKDDIEEQVHGKDDFKGSPHIDQHAKDCTRVANHELQRTAEEHGLAHIEDSDHVSK